KYARCRDLTLAQVEERLNAGLPFVVRLRSGGDPEHKITVEDLIKGKIEMPQNDEDFVILKSDGIPTYHFAHAVDDHLMHTTHVIRGDEWLSSLPKHIELFRALGFKVPKYAHIAPIMKLDNGNKRKISKRKDPEAAVSYFVSEGYPADSVIEYLMTVASSEFEVWRKQNPTLKNSDFNFNIKKMSVSGALFDHEKLDDVSKNVISKLDADTVTNAVLNWAKEYDKEFYGKISGNTEFLKGIFSIDRGVKNPRKDLAKWSDAKAFTEYFYNAPDFSRLPEHIKPSDAVTLLKEYINVYDVRESQSEWFEDLKKVCPAANFCPDTKEYRQNPQNYNGSVGDFSTVVRLCITGRQNSPDLYSIMKLIGKKESIDRIENAIRILEEA
ncbi:MAG: glutamate--tRNA ligase, partial [Oscillospiraceae bacterium]|nr:glutamate--tRNA ligase [Candidatus Equicaccousia limihippi]